MEYFHTCFACHFRIISSRLLAVSVVCVLVAVTVCQNANSAAHIVTDPPIIHHNQASGVSLSASSPTVDPSPTNTTAAGEEGEEAEGGEAGEGAEAGEVAEGAGGGREGGRAGAEGAAEGGEEGEAGEAAEGAEKEVTEGEKGGNEAMEDLVEDLMERYQKQGLTASIEALATMYPGVNMTALMIDMATEDAAEGPENEHENEIKGSEGRVKPTDKYGGKYDPLHTTVPDKYGDYEVDFLGQPKSSYTYLPTKPNTDPPVNQGNLINPTRVNQAATANTEGAQARLMDPNLNADKAAGSDTGSFSTATKQRPKHPTGMTASATVGVIFGILLLSWLVLGPAVCLAWRWNTKRREKKRMVLRRPDVHGSVDTGIMDAMVMSELGRSRKGNSGRKGQGRSRGSRRQWEQEVEEALRRSRSELESFPTTSTLQSTVSEHESKLI